MDWQIGLIFVQNPIDVSQRREPCRKNTKRARNSNLPPWTVSADAPEQVTPNDGTNDHYVDTVQTICVQNVNKQFNNSRMTDLPKKNQPKQQPGRQAETESPCEGALPDDAEIVFSGIKVCHQLVCAHIDYTTHLKRLPFQ